MHWMVLHRPLELARVTGNLGTGTHFTVKCCVNQLAIPSGSSRLAISFAPRGLAYTPFSRIFGLRPRLGGTRAWSLLKLRKLPTASHSSRTLIPAISDGRRVLRSLLRSATGEMNCFLPTYLLASTSPILTESLNSGLTRICLMTLLQNTAIGVSRAG